MYIYKIIDYYINIEIYFRILILQNNYPFNFLLFIYCIHMVCTRIV
jgi:hypothetical protein